MLDVGTNRESLLADPMYPGNRHARVRGECYDAFIDALVQDAMWQPKYRRMQAS